MKYEWGFVLVLVQLWDHMIDFRCNLERWKNQRDEYTRANLIRGGYWLGSDGR